MHSASKEFGVIKRKRKKSFKAFDPLEDIDKNKDCHIKRGKFTEDNNVKITDWLTQNNSKKSKTVKKDRNKRNDHESRENEGMNIYLEKTNVIKTFAKK